MGQLLRIEADIQGEPPPLVTWKLKDAVLKSMDRLKIENEDYHTTFIISKLQRSDTGTYTIVAKNDSGTDQVDVEILVRLNIYTTSYQEEKEKKNLKILRSFRW